MKTKLIIIIVVISKITFGQSENFELKIKTLIDSVDKKIDELNLTSTKENIYSIGIPDSVYFIEIMNSTVPSYINKTIKLEISDSVHNDSNKIHLYHYSSNCHKEKNFILDKFIDLTSNGMDVMPNYISLKLNFETGFFDVGCSEPIIYDTLPPNINFKLNFYSTTKTDINTFVITKFVYYISLNSKLSVRKCFLLEKKSMIVR